MVLTVKIGTRGLARSRNGEGKKTILRRVAGVSLWGKLEELKSSTGGSRGEIHSAISDRRDGSMAAAAYEGWRVQRSCSLWI